MSKEISDKLTAKDLEFPIFTNSHTAMNLIIYDSDGNSKLIEVPLYQVIQAGVVSNSSMLFLGDTRCGKSLAMMDINRNYFGGDADNGGHSNWNLARNNFTANGYFMDTDQSKIGPGKENMLSESKVPNKKRIKALCNNVDEINLAIPEVQVEFFGQAEGRHNDIPLGEEGYSLFLSSCNINKNNGDFAGVSQINRALLNRIPITIDFFTFKESDEDKNEMGLKKLTGRLGLAPIRDISEKILSAYKEISEGAFNFNPWISAYIRILSSGLDYCHNDSDKLKKSVWPGKCGACRFPKKDLCSLVKASATGTAESMKRFAHGIEYIVRLNHGNEVNLDPLSLVLECFKFTTYHGNLNKSLISSQYFGEDQDLMTDVIKKLKEEIEPLKPYIDSAIFSAQNGNQSTRFICISDKKGKESIEVYSKELESKLKSLKEQRDFTYKIISPFEEQVSGKTFEESHGFRMNWFNKYLDFVSNYYQKMQSKGDAQIFNGER